MRIALDPYMYRNLSIPKMVDKTAELGYEYIELSPREDFLPFYKYPRVDKARIKEFKKALSDTGVRLSSLLPLYHWAGPDEEMRKAAVRNWKRAIQIAVEMDCDLMNTEFSGQSDNALVCEQQFIKSMEELLPIFEREGIKLDIQAHPYDFCERNNESVDIIRGLDKDFVNYLYAAPHTFFYDDGVGDIKSMLEYAGERLTHLIIADTYNHRASSNLRYIVNPPGVTATVHQHLNIGEGEVKWDTFFSTLREMKFDGIATVAIFAWEDRADESNRFMLERLRREFG
ncbi:myo-inositol catabolism protein IolH [Azotobacter vinelandii CA]|uniref:Myo-inositol catabolism protein IolH n=2 Tax=Azotobacter vinelandii TaxID=354 RepID=C1DLA9_AZOVD|nr:sugar phosphate isomerase/epimerase family protein [Azotobacter vinelandii]ACO81102.1 myo-inositol catabolism protein IolH [Azotobacter vinelandii DJ]AGK13632.1 myo-inositol catabolism protein IolH [Azotobacter vinelandii CA]AGK18144.1 myo-inositol catabolism protein IolH [Azotobacter vinelandii CA6]SFX93304.1 myo-inositol catabolism protein IolH [Azotobacter vinelandii]GLK61089.1 protein iolH [Azotobacter vinelandii]